MQSTAKGKIHGSKNVRDEAATAPGSRGTGTGDIADTDATPTGLYRTPAADPRERERGLTMHCLVLGLNPRGTGLEEWTPGLRAGARPVSGSPM